MEQIPAYVRESMLRLEAAGYPAYCVGGGVRDLLMGRTPQDWDVATAAPPEAVLELFAPESFPTGLRHGTVTVRAGGKSVEITTFRRDGTYSDSRHPDTVTFTDSLEEDLSRRDFTVNAIAMDARGEIQDPFGGREDLACELLRCVGEPERRLTEDALRIMRGLRFAAVLSFAVDGETEEAMRSCRDGLQRIAPERILSELERLILGPSAGEILLAYPDILGAVLPEILPAVGFWQHNKHHCFDVWEHSVRAMEAAPRDRLIRWTLLLHDLGKPDTFTRGEDGVGHFYSHGRRGEELAEQICRRLRMDSVSRETICRLVRIHDVEIPLTEKGIRRILRKLGEEDLRRLLQVKRCDNLAQHPAYLDRQAWLNQLEALLDLVLREDQCFSLAQLAVKGNDLLAIGMQGKEIGDTLNRLLDLVVEGKAENDKELLMTCVREGWFS